MFDPVINATFSLPLRLKLLAFALSPNKGCANSIASISLIPEIVG